MPLAALSKNLWKRFIEVKDSSRQFDSIIRYGHPESTLICFYPLEAELSPLSFLPLFLMKKSKATCQSFVSLLVLWHFPSEDFSLHHKPGKNTHLLLLFLHLVLTNPKQDNAIFFSDKAYGDLGCWTVNHRGLRSKPERTHPSCTGGTQISFSAPVAESVPAHLHKPEGFLCPKKMLKQRHPKFSR